MKRVLVIALLAIVVGLGWSLWPSETKATDVPVTTVDKVDLNRYEGLWYEVARMPNRFQDKCTGNVTATYTLLDSGEMKVLNQCDTLDGEDEAEGRAKVVNTETNAELKVTFVDWLRWWYLFGGAYWIIDLDEANYSYAVVGHPSKKWGWLLSRTPELSKTTLKGIASRLNYKGYNACAFKTTLQSGSNTLANVSLCDVVAE